jgi:hypothetical protein
MENVLKHQVLDLPADKLSTHFLASNQLRLWLAGFADQLLDRLRTLGCPGTVLTRATARPGDGGQPPVETLESGGAGDARRPARVYPIQHDIPATGSISLVQCPAGAARASRRMAATLPDPQTRAPLAPERGASAPAAKNRRLALAAPPTRPLRRKHSPFFSGSAREKVAKSTRG